MPQPVPVSLVALPPPVLAVVRRLGFVHVGEQVDEQDGRELVHELTV